MTSDTDDGEGGIKILFEVTTAGAGDIFVQFAKACDRAGLSWGCFFTGDGVMNLSSDEVIAVTATAVTAKVCEFSWGRYMEELVCPLVKGHQTNNSVMVGNAEKVINI